MLVAVLLKAGLNKSPHGFKLYMHCSTIDHLILVIIYIKKLQAIYLMLYKRWCKTAKIKTYKPKLMY